MQETKKKGMGKQLRVVGWMILICYFLRLWPFVLILLATGAGLIIYSLVKHSDEQKDAPPLAPVPVRRPTPAELEREIYSNACLKVCELVEQECPGARWVWASADAHHRIQKSLPMYIILNQAGGYRRARVILLDSEVIALRFEQAGTEKEPENQPESQPDNYTLLAFQWVDANAPSLQGRCEEAASQGITELVLPEAELPVRESWPGICEELRREGFLGPRPVAEGIRLNTTKELIQLERDA